MATITINYLPQDVLVALARGAAEHHDSIEDEARRILMRFFADSRGQAQQTWARRQADLYRYGKMLSVTSNPVSVLRSQRLERDAMIGGPDPTEIVR